MTTIHPTAIVHPGAQLADDVEVGAYSLIGEHVRIGRGTVVGPHVVINGRTEIGERNRIFQFASIGEINQDLKYRGEPTRLKVGDGNTIREYVTMQIGTVTGRSETTVGDNNLFMVYCHVAHDCEIGSGCVLANNATLAGHIRIDDEAIIGGLVGIHQFCRIGTMAIIGGCSKVVQDIPPYMLADGHPARVRGINLEGIKRKKFPPEAVREIKSAYRALFHSSMKVAQAIASLKEAHPASAQVRHIVEFLESSPRGIAR
ncbi:MAG: acyl-ACP--UDP-N-acetylglucosamine O-acyltransferase [Candidatus Aureabacteria bacterium]|nr:acyl-ACP--UDP-N-acetylglucosamine O-acyltransferase [Candidatus Auribacterota bacterium]